MDPVVNNTLSGVYVISKAIHVAPKQMLGLIFPTLSAILSQALYTQSKRPT